MPASCQKGSSHPQIQTTDEQESASLSLVRGKGGVGWSERQPHAQLRRRRVPLRGSPFLRGDRENLPPQKQARAAKWPLSSNRHCLCSTPPTRLHPPLVTACSNVLWASSAVQSWRFHQSTIIVCSCQTSFVDPSLLPPATPCTVTVPLQGSTISRISKTFGSVIEGIDRPEGHNKRDHIRLGHTFFRYPGLALFCSAEGGRRHTCRQLSPCATCTATSVG